MIQTGKAGPLQPFEFIYGIFKRDREQIWSKQAFQHVVSAGGDRRGYGSLQCAGLPKAGVPEQSSAEVWQALRWRRCLCCFLGNQPVGVGAAAPGANLCIPSPPRSAALPGRREEAGAGGDTVCWEGVCSGPDALRKGSGGLGARIPGKQFPRIHGERSRAEAPGRIHRIFKAVV